jgi:ankyrin repeat protein
LGVLPVGLDATYIRTLEQIQNQPEYLRKLAFKSFAWVIYAQRPLATEELQHAVALGEDCNTTEDLEVDDITVILGACANLLVEVKFGPEQPKIIRPVHYSLYEFLLNTKATILQYGCLSKIRLSSDIHEQLATTCLTYICLTPLTGPCPKDLALWGRINQYPFIWYAAKSFGHHMLLCGNLSQNLSREVSMMLRKDHSFLAAVLQIRAVPHKTGWLQIPAPTEDFDPHDAKYSIGALVFATELYDVPGLRAKWQDLKPPPFALHYACRSGTANSVVRLIADGGEINAKDRLGICPIYYASSRGDLPILKTLLDEGADPDQTGGHFGAPMHVAARKGNFEVSKLLLENHVDPNIQTGWYGTALQAAACKGSQEIITLLLENGADPNISDGQYGTALQAAAHGGFENLVELLLRHNADVNIQGGKFGNALQAAAEKGHQRIMEILLASGADVNAHGGFYGTALHAAMCSGHEGIAQLLLDHNADVTAESPFYGTTLQAAAVGGFERLVELLLNKGININKQSGYMGTPLRCALMNNHKTLVDLLISKGAEM